MASLKEQHEISNSECDARIRRYFNDSMPAPYAVPGSELQQALGDAGDPTEWEVRLTGDPTNRTDNSELQYSVVPHAESEAAAAGTFSVAYSVALFLELFRDYVIGEVAFSKAMNADGGKDIVFKVQKTGATVYCGDMTQSWP